MTDLDEVAKTSAFVFDMVFEAKVRTLVVLLRTHRHLSDEEIKEVIMLAVDRALRVETERVE